MTSMRDLVRSSMMIKLPLLMHVQILIYRNYQIKFDLFATTRFDEVEHHSVVVYLMQHNHRNCWTYVSVVDI